MLGCLILSSCAVKSPSGFLSDFDQLDAGYGTTDAVAAYAAQGVDLKAYHSLVVDPVTTVIANPSVDPQVAEQLAAYVDESLRAEFGKHIRIVSQPGPGVLRMRAALTDVVSGVKPLGKPVTTRFASPRVSYDGKLGSDAAASFVSQVAFEAELVDSSSGRRIAALVDHRLGNKREATANTSWAAVRSGAGMGAKKLSQRFVNARGY